MKISTLLTVATLAAIGAAASGCYNDECGAFESHCRAEDDYSPPANGPSTWPLDTRLPAGTLPSTDDGKLVVALLSDTDHSSPEPLVCTIAVVTSGGFDIPTSPNLDLVLSGSSYRVDWLVDADANGVADAGDVAYKDDFTLPSSQSGPVTEILTTVSPTATSDAASIFGTAPFAGAWASGC